MDGFGPPQRRFGRRLAAELKRMAAWKRYALGAWLPALLMVAWQWMATHDVIDPLFFPPPSELLTAGGKMLASGELAGHVRATLTGRLPAF